MTDLFFRSLEDLKNRIQIQSSLGGELFLCKRMEICYNKKRDDTKREVLNMAKDERNAYTIQNDASLGEVKIADEVVAIIAALAATEVDGVASMAGNITNEVIGKLGIKNLSKGVKVDVLEGVVTVSLALNLKYDYSIMEVTKKVQEKVKNAVENMTVGRLVYQERKDLPQDLARQLKAAFTSEIDARHYASLMRDVSVIAGYKDTYVVKKSDIDVSRV